MKNVVLCMFFLTYVKSATLNSTSNLIFCESYNNNCTNVLKIFGNENCNIFLSCIHNSSKITPPIITKLSIRILLLFVSNICDSLVIKTKFNKYLIHPYKLLYMRQDIRKLIDNNLKLQLELYSLTNNFIYNKCQTLKNINQVKKIKLNNDTNRVNYSAAVLFNCYNFLIIINYTFFFKII